MLILTGRFQPFHNGHLFAIQKLRELNPNQTICVAIIKDAPFMQSKSHFDLEVDAMLMQDRNPFNADITLRLVTNVIRSMELDNIVTTLMPRASEETWPIINALFDCPRIWVFTRNKEMPDDWEEKKCAYYTSKGEKTLRISIDKSISASYIRRCIEERQFSGLEDLLPYQLSDILEDSLVNDL